MAAEDSAAVPVEEASAAAGAAVLVVDVRPAALAEALILAADSMAPIWAAVFIPPMWAGIPDAVLTEEAAAAAV